MKIIQCLLDHGMDVHIKNNADDVPIQYASMGGHLDVIKYFVSDLGN